MIGVSVRQSLEEVTQFGNIGHRNDIVLARDKGWLRDKPHFGRSRGLPWLTQSSGTTSKRFSRKSPNRT